MQDPNLERTLHSLNAETTTTSSSPFTMLIMKGGGHHHRRAHSEMSFRLPDDMTMTMMMHHSDPVNGGGGSSTASIEEIGSEDDLFSTYIDVDKLNGEENNINNDNNNNNNNNCTDMNDHNQNQNLGETIKTTTHRHRHSNSVDGSFVFGCGGGEIMEAKKAMPPDKLAELWTVDPKRAKRILANRQSAARSKERKARHIVELERKVQTLQTEATTLSAQLTLFQRDTNGLSIENTELKLRLQSMEQQAQLCDALNETLKKVVDRLKMATGEMISPSDSFNLEMHHNMPSYAQSNFYPVSQQQEAAGSHNNMTLPLPFGHYPFHQTNSLPDYMQNDPLGRLQGLDISSKGLSIVKSEGPSLSASDQSSSNF